MSTYSTMNGEGDEENGRPASSSSSGRARRSRLGRGRKDVGFVGEASWISSVVNLLNTIVGAGVLAMPLALSHMGIVLGIIVIVWAGITSAFGLYLQARCARYIDRGYASFFALSQMTYPNAAVLFDAAIAIKCFGVGVSYLIIIGDLMPGVVRGFNDSPEIAQFLLDRHFWVTVFMLAVIPLSYLRKLDSLKYTSIIALISIGYLVVLVLAHFFMGDTIKERGNVHVVTWAGPVQALSSFPVIVFAYTCHQNMFSILNEIANNSHFRTTGVIIASIGTAAVIYVIVAVTGYLQFGDNVMGNIVAMYKPSVASTIGKAAIVVLVMFSYPLQVHPCRASVDAVLKWRPAGRKAPRTSPRGSPAPAAPLLTPGRPGAHSGGDHIGELRFAILTTIIIILSYIVAMTVSSLEKVLAYVGSTGSTAISFILPGLFYYKISDPESFHHQRLMKEDDDEADEEPVDDEETTGMLGGIVRRSAAWRKPLLRKLSLALAIYGIVVMIVCLITNTFFIVAH